MQLRRGRPGSYARTIWDSIIGQWPLLPSPFPLKDPLRAGRGRDWLIEDLWAWRLSLLFWEVFSRWRRSNFLFLLPTNL